MGHLDRNSSNREIISRDKEVLTILEKLSPGAIGFLVGKMGAGKSSIMHSIIRRDPDHFYWFNGSIFAYNPIDRLAKRVDTFPDKKMVMFDEAITILLTTGDSFGVLKLLADKGTLLSVTHTGLMKFLTAYPWFFLRHTKTIVYLNNENLRKPGRDLGSINTL